MFRVERGVQRTANAPAGNDRDRPGIPRPAGTTTAGTLSPAALLGLQRSAGNAAVARMLAERQGDQQVQRLAVHDVLRSPGRPLDEPVRAEMEARLGTDFSAVRLHTGPTAQRSATELGARAYTVGENVVIGEGGTDAHVLAHELTHVVQQRQGPVAGSEHSDGVRVSDPSDRFERAAEDNARRVMSQPVPTARPTTAGQGPVASPDTQVQRYVVVQPGADDYPERGWMDDRGGREPAADEEFFPAQEQINNSYVGANGEINLRYGGRVPLRIAKNKDLAIEDTKGRPIQAKTFFATEERIRKANQHLRGMVKFEGGGAGNYLELRRARRRSLIMRGGDEKVILWEVEPVVVREPMAGQTEPSVERGLDVRLEQRCNEMASSVTGRRGLTEDGENRYFEAIADLLGELTNTPSDVHKQRFYDAQNAVVRNRTNQTIGAYMAQLASMLQQVMALRDDPTDINDRFGEAVSKHKLNEYTPPPKIGDVLMLKALNRDATSGALDYHFAGVIVTSGDDHITMENYARHEGQETLSNSDPQWYFQMYGPPEQLQSWHEAWGWDKRFPERFVLSILLSG